MTALEAGRPLHLSDQERTQNADEHEHGEQVDREREPTLASEPGQRRVPVDSTDHRDHDRREEDEEAPEDDRVQSTRHQPLEQLPLTQHDLGLCTQALRPVVEALDRLATANEPPEEPRAPAEEHSGHCEERREGQRAR